MRTIIIAEAGVNHNGSLEMAKELIDAAVTAEVDYVKFQTFTATALVSIHADKADYQQKLTDTHESQFEMIQKLELDRTSHEILIDYCNRQKIQFLSTAFDSDSINLLAELNIPFYKIPSGEITNLPYLRQIGGMGKPVVMSTGMATLNEAQAAMGVLVNAGVAMEDLTLLHCNTEYPTPMRDVNLRAMLTMRDELGVKVGYSDHTQGIEVPIAAVALGATIVEKHFTLDRDLPGPDHRASLEPAELIEMVKAIRNIESALGEGVKQPSKSEQKNITIARKSLVAKKAIRINDIFDENNITAKRPGTGISPMKWDSYIGKRATKNYKRDDLI